MKIMIYLRDNDVNHMMVIVLGFVIPLIPVTPNMDKEDCAWTFASMPNLT